MKHHDESLILAPNAWEIDNFDTSFVSEAEFADLADRESAGAFDQ